MFKNIQAIFLILLHFVAIISFFFIKNISVNTIVLQFVFLVLSQIAITGGYHRLWAHRSYQASELLEKFYLFFGTMASQGTAINWVKEHRTHHRNEEKNGDPYNINKGFWHAHVGWLIKEADEITKSEIAKTDVSDLKKKQILVFQERYYTWLWILIALVIPTLLCSLWDDAYNGFLTNFIRIVLVLNFTWFVNSLAHYEGNRQYDNTLKACDNLFVSIITMGEGWHNYHHSYPKDYRASPADKYNPTTCFIDFTRKLGLSDNHYHKRVHDSCEDKFDIKSCYSKLDSS
jgi:stearoyl-CoA desaturase (delta-9 desaturase)